MARTRKRAPRRRRIGHVSYYVHHGAWHIYYREGSRQVRRRVGDSEELAAQVAAQVNAQLSTAAPTLFSFTPVTVAELRRRFLDHHEHILRSSLATVRRYRAATQHLENFASGQPAHELDAEAFVRHLRTIRVAPNGHAKATRRPLRDKGVRFILETCRSLYGFAAKKRCLPPYADNPFAGLGGKRFPIEDAKRVFVFDAASELAFLNAADAWSFPIHFTLAKTGLRPGELIHLLIEDIDLNASWLTVTNKPELGWRIKTRRQRVVPLVDELVAVLRRVIGNRRAGPVFLRQQFNVTQHRLADVSRERLARAVEQRIEQAEQQTGQPLSREGRARVAHTVWRDAGAIKPERIRQSFIRLASAAGLSGATCPKTWRHTFATLLQDANVDPLVRQITLGHAPMGSAEGALGMTSVYTHTRPETQRREILRAVQLWSQSLQLAERFAAGLDWPSAS